MNKKVLITGINGQDGSYLAELLLNKNYEIHGLVKKSCDYSLDNISHILNGIKLHYGDVSDEKNLCNLICDIMPDEIYNFAAVSTIFESSEFPNRTKKVNALAPLSILGSIKAFCPSCRFCQASSSELFGHSDNMLLNEKSKFNPSSLYALAKLEAYEYVKYFREIHNIFSVNSILFNHESYRRKKKFVTKKIIAQACEIKYGKRDKIMIGNVDSLRDWGFAGDYVEAMWLMLQQEQPDDYVIATGETHSVREFCNEVFSILNIDLLWGGKNQYQKAINSSTGKILIEINEEFYDKSDIFNVRGDISKAKNILGWSPKTSFKGLIKNILENELKKYAEN